ncbi:J domain-containing protein [Halosolutus amylolyticus]|uniref:J domain-containing protein n=1 Tax=Halosolutus amylolyticus TaxID=2932267 RepID=A0ABD5PN04_9EURY|nr:J domain-containing protein [Halosolutus amylolyticus]
MAVAGERQAGCDGCGRTVPLEELTTVTMPDGETVVCCPACAPHARAAAEKSASLDQRRETCDGCAGEFLETELEAVTLPDDTTIDCCPSCLDTAPQQDEDADETTSDGGADDESLCRQCNEWVREELFRVTTIDGRNERLCPSCKEQAEEDGIVRDVELRKSRAREILGVEKGASDEAIREAYHEHVKRAHPDQKSGSKSAFQLVKGAYDRLLESDR